jgi:hypothetical protein
VARCRRARHECGGVLRVAPRARRTAPRHRAHHASTHKATLTRRERATPGPSRVHAALRDASKAAGPRRGPAAPRRNEPDRASNGATSGGTPQPRAAPCRGSRRRGQGRAGRGRCAVPFERAGAAAPGRVRAGRGSTPGRGRDAGVARQGGGRAGRALAARHGRASVPPRGEGGSRGA